MKIKLQVRDEPTANPVPAVIARARRFSDGVTIASLSSDSDGFLSWQRNGHPERFYITIQDIPGGDKSWSSYDAMAAGAISLPELPIGLRAMGDGVIRGYGSDYEVSAGGEGLVLVEDGAALVGGYPVVCYLGEALTYTRPVTSTRIDRVIARVYPDTSATTPGKAEIALLAGTEGGSAPSLTQTDQVYEISLAQVSIPTALPITITDERAYVGETVMTSGVARASSASTTESGGEALSGLSVDLVLPKTKLYTINAEVAAVQNVATGWELLGTFGSFGSGIAPNFNSPGQVAIDGSGNVYIVDNGNARIVKLDATGAYLGSISSLTGITGVAIDASGFIYAMQGGAVNAPLKRYTSGHVLTHSITLGSGGFAHVAVDGSNVYVAGGTFVYRGTAATLSSFSAIGSSGSGNGQFTAAYGIAADGTHIYVSDLTLARIQKFTNAGVYVTQWSAPGIGVAIDSGGDVWIADQTNDLARHFTNTGTAVETVGAPDSHGIAFASGDVLWITQGHAISKWDELPGGYGQLAIEIDSNVGTYTGIGQISGSVTNMRTTTFQGPGTCTVRAFGKATADTAAFGSLMLSARAEV